MKKTYESIPYAGTLQPYGPKPVKVKPEEEKKKEEKKESSGKKDKRFYQKKDRKPIKTEQARLIIQSSDFPCLIRAWNKYVNLRLAIM